jgi:hypothetical protein
VTPVAAAGDTGAGDALLHQQDHAAVGGDQLEGLHDDLLQQKIDVDLQTDGSL